MFRQVLYTQLKWTRLALAITSVIAFAAPAALWRSFSGQWGATSSAMDLVMGFAMLGPLLAVIAFLSGFLAVAQPFGIDAAARHVYPLSLPIPWSRYVALRFGAGAVLLAIPAVALLLGCLFVLALVDLPATLQAYPITLTLRFLLGSLVAYAIVFAVQYLSGRKAAYLLFGFLVLLVVASFGLGLLGYGRLVPVFTSWLFTAPGPLAVFGADWMLIDV